jgi:hypothetical protein
MHARHAEVRRRRQRCADVPVHQVRAVTAATRICAWVFNAVENGDCNAGDDGELKMCDVVVEAGRDPPRLPGIYFGDTVSHDEVIERDDLQYYLERKRTL